MEIVIDENSIAVSLNGQITGAIYFKVGSRYFPEKNWNDFLITVLSWWINSFVDSLDNRSKSFEMNFMEGPYKVLGEIKEQNRYETTFIKQGLNKDEILFSSFIRQDEVINMFDSACRIILAKIAKIGISSKNIVALKKTSSRLKI